MYVFKTVTANRFPTYVPPPSNNLCAVLVGFKCIPFRADIISLLGSGCIRVPDICIRVNVQISGVKYRASMK